MFFLYRQNNPGGRTITNDRVAEDVIIEAEDGRAADDRAEAIGIYFDGSTTCGWCEGCEQGYTCYNAQDCPCCGDRWYRNADSSGWEQPNSGRGTGYLTRDTVPDTVRLYFAGSDVSNDPAGWDRYEARRAVRQAQADRHFARREARRQVRRQAVAQTFAAALDTGALPYRAPRTLSDVIDLT